MEILLEYSSHEAVSARPIRSFVLCPSSISDILNVNNAIAKLKTSLSQTLVKFHPLAGKIYHDAYVEVRLDDGVAFTEARAGVSPTRLSPISSFLWIATEGTEISVSGTEFRSWPCNPMSSIAVESPSACAFRTRSLTGLLSPLS